MRTSWSSAAPPWMARVISGGILSPRAKTASRPPRPIGRPDASISFQATPPSSFPFRNNIAASVSSGAPLRAQPSFDLARGFGLGKAVTRLQAADQLIAAAADAGHVFVGELDPIAADLVLEVHPVELNPIPVHRRLLDLSLDKRRSSAPSADGCEPDDAASIRRQRGLSANILGPQRTNSCSRFTGD